MKLRTLASLAPALVLAAGWSFAQRNSSEVPSWAPKATAPTKWAAPHKPHTKLADIKKAHAGEKEWAHTVVDDAHLNAQWIQAQPGTKVSPRFHPDTRAWWVVWEGQVRFQIEGQEPFVATKGSMVQVPMQTIFSMESVGDAPSLRFEVNIAKAKTLYPNDVKPPALPGFEWIPVRLNRKAQPYGYNNKPHINLFELNKEPKYRGGRFVHDDRAVSNIIYGYEKDLSAYDPKAKGHYHPECAEFWLIMAGQIRYNMEYAGDIIADAGDVVYAPPFTFHAPRFHGEGPSCRLAMNGFPNISHLFEAK